MKNTSFCQRCTMLGRAIPAPAEIFYAGRKGKLRFQHLCAEHVVEWRERFPELAVIYSASEWAEYQAAERVRRALTPENPQIVRAREVAREGYRKGPTPREYAEWQRNRR